MRESSPGEALRDSIRIPRTTRVTDPRRATRQTDSAAHFALLAGGEGSGGLLKERGAEKSGYRGCLVSALVFGLIGGVIAIWWSRQYALETAPDMPVVLMSVMFGVVGFVAGGVVGVLMSFLLDLLVRKREHEEDEF